MKSQRKIVSIMLASALTLALLPTVAMGSTVSVVDKFSDISSSDWFVSDAQWAYDNDIIHGYSDGTFGTGKNITRAEFAQVLLNQSGESAVTTKDTTGEADLANVEWYTGACNWAFGKGYITGYGGTNNFGPNDPLTRAQAVTILWRMAGSPESTTDISYFPDASEIPDYAKTAFSWALENEILTGAVHDGASYAEPNRNVLREEIAKIIHKATLAEEQDGGKDDQTTTVIPSEPITSVSPSTPDVSTTPSAGDNDSQIVDDNKSSVEDDIYTINGETRIKPSSYSDEYDLSNGKWGICESTFSMLSYLKKNGEKVYVNQRPALIRSVDYYEPFISLYYMSDDGTKCFLVSNKIDFEVSIDTDSLTLRVIATPEEGSYLTGVLDCSYELPYVSVIICKETTCPYCGYAAYDSNGNRVFNYLVNSEDSADIDSRMYKSYDSTGPTVSAKKALESGQTYYGEYDEHVSGKTIAELESEVSKYYTEDSVFLTESTIDDYDVYPSNKIVLLSPSEIASGKFYCQNTECKKYGEEITPLLERLDDFSFRTVCAGH